MCSLCLSLSLTGFHCLCPQGETPLSLRGPLFTSARDDWWLSVKIPGKKDPGGVRFPPHDARWMDGNSGRLLVHGFQDLAADHSPSWDILVFVFIYRPGLHLRTYSGRSGDAALKIPPEILMINEIGGPMKPTSRAPINLPPKDS